MESYKNFNNFINPLCEPRQLDTFLIRVSILNAIKNNQPNFCGVLLDIGCGQMPYKSLITSPPSQVTQYIGLDFEVNPIHNNKPNITWQNGQIPLADNSVDCAICTEVLEHCPEPDAVLLEISRVLKPGGLFFFTVPFLWPLHEVPYDHYRYTPFALQRHLEQTGFNQIELKAMGGWDASLAQMLGLWLRRRPMNRWLRAGLSYLCWPIVWLLAQLDKQDKVAFIESTMISGIAGTARKAIRDKL